MPNGKLLESHAREKLAMPESWTVFRWESFPKTGRVGDTLYFELTGVVAPPKLSGKHKGQPNWRKGDKATEKTVVITVTEHAAWVKDWHAKTGLCVECLGKGEVFASWNHETGTTYRPCKACDSVAISKPPISETQAALFAPIP